MARKPKPVSQAEFARMMGVSRQRVGRLVHAGRLPLTEEGRIDPVVGRQVWATLAVRVEDGEVRGAGRAESVAAPEVETAVEQEEEAPRQEAVQLLEAKARIELAKAGLEELKLAERRKELVSRAKAERLLETVMGSIRGQVMAIPARVSTRLAGADQRTLEIELTKELRRALEVVGGQL